MAHSARGAGMHSGAHSTRAFSTSRSQVPQRGFYVRHLRLTLPATLVLCVLVGLCVFDVVYNWGTIHAGVTVEGVEVGGLSVEEAAERIESSLQSRIETADVIVYEGDASDATSSEEQATLVQSADAAEEQEEAYGFDTDGDGTVEQWGIDVEELGIGVSGTQAAQDAYAYGRSGNVVAQRLGAWVGGHDVDAEISYDDEAFSTLVDEINEAIGTEVVNSKAKISDEGEVELAEGSDGWLLDEEEFVSRLSSSFFDNAASACITPMHTVAMYIQPETARNIVKQIQEAISSDVTITYEDETWTMDAAALGSVIGQKVLEPGQYLVIGDATQSVEEGDTSLASYDMTTGEDATSGYVLQAFVNQKKFDAYLVELLGDKADGDAQDASFDTSSGEVVIVESVTGEGPDRVTAEHELQDMLFGDDEDAQRSIVIEDTVIEPDLTTEQAEAMGITEKLASWSIAMSGSSNRQHNIKLLCSLIDGSLTAPGESWSFNETTGERTEEKGFKTAPVIVNGTHEDQLGGGICQVATCVFNAACYSGLGIGTRSNHTYYISAYDDEGFADATVSWKTPDLVWVNDTDNYILLTASAVEGGYVTVSLWGTDDGRTVTCERGEWEEGEEYETVYEEDDTLAEGVEKVTQSGVNGRSIYIRYLVESADGEVLHDINFHSVYAAEDEIITVGTKKTSSSSSSQKSDDEEDDEETSDDDAADETDDTQDEAQDEADDE